MRTTTNPPNLRQQLSTLVAILAVAGATYAGTRGQPAEHSSPAAIETRATAGQPTASANAPVEEQAPSPEPEPSATPTPQPTGGPFGSQHLTGGRHVTLTFDDGPDPEHTPRILALLREHRVKAVFCVVGVQAQAHPDLIRAIAADGHTLCNHSWDHDFRLGSRSPAAIRADLGRTNQAIRDAVPGVPIAYYRQPGGYWTKTVVTVARELGMTALHWTVDPQDWARPGAEAIARRVIDQTVPGAIVLLHDGGGDRRGTVSALRAMLPVLSRRFELAALPPDAGTPH
ncbi:MAG TPA: polysaccharide deacetylase family protein [Micromonosporaceae bacterium]